MSRPSLLPATRCFHVAVPTLNRTTTQPGGLLDEDAEKALAEEHIGQFFKYEHLPPYLADVSRPFCEMAVRIVVQLPRNPERTVALRKLLEAKDAAVRAVVAK
jgi:hypothetical protein